MAVKDPGVILAFRCHFKHLLGVVREIEQQIIDSDIHAIELIGDREAVGHDRSELFIRSHELGIDDLNRHKTLEKFAVDRPAVLQNSVVNVITQGAQCFLVIKDGVINGVAPGDQVNVAITGLVNNNGEWTETDPSNVVTYTLESSAEGKTFLQK